MFFADWVTFSISRPFPFGPWWHRLIFVLMLAVTALVIFFAIVAEGFETNFVLSTDFDMDPNEGIPPLLARWIQPPDTGSCLPQVFSKGQRFYTTNGFLEWRVKKVFNSSEYLRRQIPPLANGQTKYTEPYSSYIPQDNRTTPMSFMYKGEKLDVCDIVWIDAQYQIDQSSTFRLVMQCAMQEWAAEFETEYTYPTHVDIMRDYDLLPPDQAPSAIMEAMFFGVDHVLGNHTWYKRVTGISVENRCGNSTKCLDEPPRFFLHLLDYQYMAGLSKALTLKGIMPLPLSASEIQLIQEPGLNEFIANHSAVQLAFGRLDIGTFHLNSRKLLDGVVTFDHPRLPHGLWNRTVRQDAVPAQIDTQFLCHKTVPKSPLSFFYSIFGLSTSLLGTVWGALIMGLSWFYERRRKYHDYFNPFDEAKPLGSASSPSSMKPAHSANTSITQPLLASSHV